MSGDARPTGTQMLYEERRKRAEWAEGRLRTLRVARREELEDIARFETEDFLTVDAARQRDFRPCAVGTTWHRDRTTTAEDRLDADADLSTGEVSPALSVGQTVWFRLRATIPDSMAGLPVHLRFIARPLAADETPWTDPRVESLCYLDGNPVKSFDNGHDSLKLTDQAEGGEAYEFLVEAGTTTHFGRFDTDWFQLQTAELAAERPAVAALHRHVSVLNDLYQTFDRDSPAHERILDAIVEASRIFAFDATADAAFHESATAALDHLQSVEAVLPSDIANHRVTASGHAHLDPAWRWPWSEAVRKAARSFTNVLGLLDADPDMTFTQSMPHMYEWIRHRYPVLWEDVCDAVDRGQWQPTGALWVETDVNATGAETLARQFLLGKRYFRSTFDVDPTVTFLPDTFGFSAGFPGIAAAADCPYLFTGKLGRSEINEFPHTTFRWTGIDGSELLAHYPAVDSYNGTMTAGEVTETVYGDAQNHVAPDRCYLFGLGDGGGGPSREMVERRAIMNDIEALPDVEYGSVADVFERLDADRDRYPRWSGEIYLEWLRGTYNTGSRIKRDTRRGEQHLREAELWSALARATDPDVAYPHEELTAAWRTHLFVHVHDVVTRASIAEVYADARRDYAGVFERAATARADAIEALVGPDDGGELLCLLNPLSWDRSVVASVPQGLLAEDADVGTATPVDGDDALAVQRTTPGMDEDVEADEVLLVETPRIPGFGARTVEITPEPPETTPFEVSATRLSNGRVTVTFADDGTIAVTDEEADREVLADGGNRLVLHPNEPLDKKDVDQYSFTAGEQLPAPTVEVLESGPVRATVRQRRTFGDSELVQDVSLTRNANRVDFRTRVDWQAEHKLLKAYFPTGLATTIATYDTHFGHHRRHTHENTTWDAARFEEPGGTWVDVSEPDYGVAVLNNGKYGVHVDGGEISQTLLRSQRAPDPAAELGTHAFTYSLLPHNGGPVAGGVNRAADALNARMGAVRVTDPISFAPMSVADDGVIVEAVKRHEDEADHLVMRLYEAEGNHTSTAIDLEFPVAGIYEANLIEDLGDEIPFDESTVELAFEPFEIRTLVLELP